MCNGELVVHRMHAESEDDDEEPDVHRRSDSIEQYNQNLVSLHWWATSGDAEFKVALGPQMLQDRISPSGAHCMTYALAWRGPYWLPIDDPHVTVNYYGEIRGELEFLDAWDCASAFLSQEARRHNCLLAVKFSRYGEWGLRLDADCELYRILVCVQDIFTAAFLRSKTREFHVSWNLLTACKSVGTSDYD